MNVIPVYGFIFIDLGIDFEEDVQDRYEHDEREHVQPL
jgi:hypothetical protein